MRSLANEFELGVLGWFGAQKRCFGFVPPKAGAVISASAQTEASTCRPKPDLCGKTFWLVITDLLEDCPAWHSRRKLYTSNDSCTTSYRRAHPIEAVEPCRYRVIGIWLGKNPVILGIAIQRCCFELSLLL